MVYSIDGVDLQILDWIARVLFYVDKSERMVLLHAFIKKSRTTPADDLDLARINKRKHERGLP